MAEADVAVVIVTYKTPQLTIQALQSVASQRGEEGLKLRAVVVDNDSGDLPAVAEAIEQYGWSSWATAVKAPRNGGFAYGNNFGIARAYAHALPDYIYLLNPDAEVRPGAIALLVRFLAARPDVGIAGSSFEDPDGTPWPIAFRFPSAMSELDSGLQWGLVSRLLKDWVVAREMTAIDQPVDWICGASMLIRPAVITAIGGLDENYFLYYEETDFCLRAKRAGYPTWYVPASRVMHIRGQSTTVTDNNLGPRRLPNYWFDSRRRYFRVTFGFWRAALIDLIAVVANSLGLLKRTVQGKRKANVPYFVRDLIRHSIVWPRNRSVPAADTGAQIHKPASAQG